MHSDNEIIEEAKIWVKANKKKIINNFLGDNPTKSEKPFTIFMAGSPGAGKTETSKNFIKELRKVNHEIFTARIDPDEIREIIPGYTGSNSYLFQGASAIGVEKLYDYVLEKKINAIVDGTLSNLDVARKNISRSVNKGRKTSIFYIYQDPIIAWEFTKIREKVEGRNIPKEVFIDSLFAAKKNIRILKSEFKDQVEIFLLVKNFNTGMEKAYFNILNIDNYLKINYTKKSLIKTLC